MYWSYTNKIIMQARTLNIDMDMLSQNLYIKLGKLDITFDFQHAFYNCVIE